MANLPSLPLLRTSERATFKRCPQRWVWAYQERLKRKDGHEGAALLFGQWVHEAMAEFYIPGRKRGTHPRKTFLKIYRSWLKDGHEPLIMKGEDERYEAGELGSEMMDAYVNKYGDDPDIEIVAPELPFMVKLIDRGGQPFYYIGRFDALALWIPTGSFAPLEHKTGSERKKNALQTDEQAGSYWSLTPIWLKMLRRQGLLKKRVNERDIDFILYNFMRKARVDQRPENSDGFKLNKDGSVSKKQPPPAFERIQVYRDLDDRRTMRERIRDERYVMRLVEQGDLPVLKNFTDDCPYCPFYDMCELHETRSDWESFRDQVYVVGDPYADYQDAMKEVNSGNDTKKKKQASHSGQERKRTSRSRS